jgi:hypothetical protein
MSQFLKKLTFVLGIVGASLLSSKQTEALEQMSKNSYYNPTDIINYCQEAHKNDPKAYQECLKKGLLEKDYKKFLDSQKTTNSPSSLEHLPTDGIAIESGEDILDDPNA